MPSVVAVNRFPTDTDAEINLIIDKCKTLDVNVVLSNVWAEGGKGGIELANEVVRLCEKENSFDYLYDVNDSIENKINEIVTKIYGGLGAEFSPAVKKQIAQIESLGYGKLPICMAKTQYSFSDDPSLLGAPTNFTVKIKSIKLSAGAGFVVVLTGDIMTMPGLPKVPAAENIDVNDQGFITGLF